MAMCMMCGAIVNEGASTCPQCGHLIKKKSLSQALSKSSSHIITKYEMEEEKKKYALSFGEEYEYDVVTILNSGHGRVDTKEMMRVMNIHAAQGWRLHSIYSNELGKNALTVLGLGSNSTACEDVLVFERRIKIKD